MFTGIVRELGRLSRVSLAGGISHLEVDAPRTAPALAAGDSLAVNGICLTVTRVGGSRVSLDGSAETRRVTTLGRWRVGDRLHLEPAVRLGDPLGGHIVYGHVDGTGRVMRVARRAGTVQMTVSLSADLCRYLVSKGSIAVDGVSLTLDAGPFAGSFTVTLVPHTLNATRFGTIRAGDLVNIELDPLVKAARRTLSVEAITALGWTQPPAGRGNTP